MRKLVFILSLVALVGCYKNASESKSQFKEQITLKDNVKLHQHQREVNSKNDSLHISLKEIQNEKLIGMVKMDSTSTLAKEKYGFDVSNGCYSCNLASIKIESDILLLKNYCDPKEFTQMKILRIDKTSYKIKIMTEEAVFIFLKIEHSPIFKLSIKGKLNTSLIINKYFTIESKISSFSIHDCGNFEG